MNITYDTGDLVTVSGWDGTWKVIAYTGRLLHITRAGADPRTDLREIPVTRVTRAEVQA